jgi:outer membrane protein TolC
VCAFASVSAFAQFPDTLDLDQAVALAIENHASLRAAAANLQSADAGKSLALSGYWPQIGFSASGVHTEGTFVFNPSIASRNQIYSTYTSGFSASQLIYDFGKTSNRVGATSDLIEATKEDYRSVRDAVILNVSVAYYTALEAADITKVNVETVGQAEDHLTRARAFYTVGRRPMLDVTSAEVDLANANVALIRAKNSEQVALLQLQNGMGIHTSRRILFRTIGRLDSVVISLDSAKSIGFRNRSDVLAARARYEALDAFASATWSQHLPTISASGTYNWSGFDEKLFGRWTAGVTFSLPIFQGFGIDAQVDQARAAAAAQLAQVRLTLENAMLDIEQNYLGVQEAEERIPAANKLLEKAEESLRQAERQYAAGVGTAIEVTDAQVARANARITAIQARYDEAVAIARLHRAMGGMADQAMR